MITYIHIIELTSMLFLQYTYLHAYIHDIIVSKTYSALDDIGGLKDSYLNIILVEMMAPILSPDQVDKIVRSNFVPVVFTLHH